jgi:hypothetical protein
MILYGCLFWALLIKFITCQDKDPFDEIGLPNGELMEKGAVNKEIENLLSEGISRSDGSFRSVLRKLQGTDWEWVITSFDSFFTPQQRTRFRKRIDNNLQLASPNVLNLINFHFPVRYLYSIVLIDVIINYANEKTEPLLVLKEIIDALKGRQQYMSPGLQDFLDIIELLDIR